jgi:thiol-disulfide isomerase/thioredoxin
MKKTGLFVIVALLALAGGILTKALLLNTAQTNSAPLPDFNLPDVSGNTHNISKWQGKIRVINFWATWCTPCRKEIPEFIALQEKYADRGLQFIGIAIDDQDSVKKYLASVKINYPMLIGDVAGIGLARQFGNSIDVVPFTIIVDRQGQIIHRHPGEFSKAQITEIITPLITAHN